MPDCYPVLTLRSVCSDTKQLTISTMLDSINCESKIVANSESAKKPRLNDFVHHENEHQKAKPVELDHLSLFNTVKKHQFLEQIIQMSGNALVCFQGFFLLTKFNLLTLWYEV